MKRIVKIFTLTTISIGIFLTLASSIQTRNALTKYQAIGLAEQFIVDNGYTNLPADKSKLSFELFDQLGNKNNIDSILKWRHNTLQLKAFCIGEDNDSWDIGFLSTKIDISKLDSVQRKSNLPGRAVIVMKDGKEIRMAHKDPLFSTWEKIN